MPDLMFRHPVSRRWYRLLLERMNAVEVIHRVAANMALASGASVNLKWYPSQALDFHTVPSRRQDLGRLWQGTTSDHIGVSKRAWQLREGTLH